jgi:protein-S-isoprenylcysteine O-methyltransferase Ste14
VLGVLAILLARPTPRSLLLGAPLALAGEALRLWASGHIEKTRALATGGPYAHTRNPLYLGSLLLGLGLAVAAGSVWVAAIVAGYFAAFYPAVMRDEAAFLTRTFPEYRAWAEAVPLFLPRATPGGARATRYSGQRVAHNREWRTALAVPAVIALLWLRGQFGGFL